MIGLINSEMNKIEAMISLLKHPFCLIHYADWTGPKCQRG